MDSHATGPTTSTGSASPEPAAAGARRPSVAVIGAGVSGLTAAYLLSRTHDVTLFEAEDRLGGHAHTHDVTDSDGRRHAVDSGFIVHNDVTYPWLRKLFGELDVEVRPTEMSMSVRCDGCGLEYAGGRGLRGIFAQPRRLIDPRFARMLWQVSQVPPACVWPSCARARTRTSRPTASSWRARGSATTSSLITPFRSSRACGPPGGRPRWPTRRATSSGSSTTTACCGSAGHLSGTASSAGHGSTSSGSPGSYRTSARPMPSPTSPGARTASRSGTSPGRSPGWTASSSRRTPTRRSACSLTRATRRSPPSSSSATRPTRRFCTPTARSCRRPAAPGRRGTTG